MGNLKSGATYIYERANGIVYAREIGADPSTRQEIGWDYDPRTADGRPLVNSINEDRLWGEIRRAAKDNPVLQKELDRVIMLHHLSKDNGKE